MSLSQLRLGSGGGGAPGCVTSPVSAASTPAGSSGPTPASQLLMSRSPALSNSSLNSGGIQPPPPSVSLSAPGGGPPRRSPGTPCCENGRPIMMDPATGQTICSCQYPAGLLAAAYPRMGVTAVNAAESMYGTYAAAAAAAQAGLLQIGNPEAAQLYPGLNAPYELKEGPDGLRSLAAPQPLSYYPYEGATLAGYPYSYGGMDLSAAARRKNATRENTNTLKAWLYEHRKNPYPTKGEKIMLAIITKMTLTQVSTWFANARRRLKKENKMTWSPRNRPEDEDDDDDDLLSDQPESERKLEDASREENLNTYTKMVDVEHLDSEDDDEIIDAGTEADYREANNNIHGLKSPTDRLNDSIISDCRRDSRCTSPERQLDACSSPHSPERSRSSPNISRHEVSVEPKELVKPRIWSVAEMASSSHKESFRSPHKENEKTSSDRVEPVPVRSTVSLGPSQGDLSHPPRVFTSLPGPSGPHGPVALNGLCAPAWFGLSGGYPLPFSSRTAHPYLLSAASMTSPGVGAPPAGSALTHQALRAHQDFLKQASSLYLPVHERSGAQNIAMGDRSKRPELNEATAFRPVPTRPTMAC